MAILPLLAAATAASAATFDITSVGVESYNTLNVNGTNAIASAIGLTVQGDSKPLWVWCVDIDHQVYIQNYTPPLVYKTGLVTTDSTGATSGVGKALSQTVSGEIQTLAEIGTGLANSASPDSLKLTAIQGAIWEVEYGFTPSQVTSSTAQVNTDIASYVSYAEAHPASSYAQGIYSVGANTQGFGYTQGFATGVPEPTAWTLLILGFAQLGAGLRCSAAAKRLSPMLAKRERA